MNKVSVPESIIRKLSEYLMMGMVCYLHKQTFDLLYHPVEMIDEEMFEDVLEKIEKSDTEFIQVEPMKSGDSFRVMVEFAEGLQDEETRVKLIKALNHPKPFQNFKN